MNKTFENFNELKDSACLYMRENLLYSEHTIGNYDRIWRKVRGFMLRNRHTQYTNTIGESFLNSLFGNKIFDDLSKDDRKYLKAIKSLNEFKKNGTMTHRTRRKSKFPLKFNGPIGNHISSFISHLRSLNRKPSTIKDYSRYLFDFMKFCEIKKVKSPQEIDLAFSIIFLDQYEKLFITTMVRLTMAIRGFIKFLFIKDLINFDFSHKIPRAKYVKCSKTLSFYSEEEIQKLIASLDRSTPVDKRNFAMILMTVRTGLRVSDIVGLKFKELNWDNSTIRIEQYKTGVQIKLPLTTDVGNAIIDYLKFGRPECNSPYIFMRSKAPIEKPLNRDTFTVMVQRAITKAGLRTKDRNFGPHSLRNSLAARMLENSTALHVITEVLGHKNSESTKHYIRIDFESMRTCVLEVLPIKQSFYEQGGGLFYG